MEEQLNAVSPFLVKVEVLLALVAILVGSIAWLMWEIFTYALVEPEELNNDWWEALRTSAHHRLIIPPDCVEEVVELGTLSRFTTATTDAMKKMTGVVSSGFHRTHTLFSGASQDKRLSKAARKSSRPDLTSIAAEPGQQAGGLSKTKDKRKGSRVNLQAADVVGSVTPLACPPTTGRMRPRAEHLSCSAADELLLAPPPDALRHRRSSTRVQGAEHRCDTSSPLEAPANTCLTAASPSGAHPSHDAATTTTPPTRIHHAPQQSGSGSGRAYIFKDLPEGCTPLLAFVNSRSGVSQGGYLIHQLRRLLNPIQVVDLATEEPARALRQFLDLPRLRILVCGGDGTAKWIMGVLEQLEVDCWPPIAILPLGTGNDMARVLGWGGGYAGESIVDFLAQVQRAHVVVADRWEMKVTTSNKGKPRIVTFNNYFGIGVDAQAALKFHHLREQRPQLFFSRIVNKMWYGFLGAQDLFRRSCVNLPDRLKVVADGHELDLPPTIQGLMFLNIESWGGGVKLWDVEPEGTTGGGAGGLLNSSSSEDDDVQERPGTPGNFLSASMQDGMLDVVAVNGVVHLGQLQVGLSKPLKICQGREFVITTTKNLPMQVDGEPWPQQKCVIKLSRKQDPAYLLQRTCDTGGAVASELGELLEWAQSSSVISVAQKKSLQVEFSRRVELKRRTLKQEMQVAENASKTHLESTLRLAPDRARECIIS